MEGPGAKYIVGIDTGGTFTDITVMMLDGTALTEKVPTTPWDGSEGVLAAIDQAAMALGLATGEFLNQAVIKHGCAVAENALLAREGARVGLITTRGFEDTTFIMRAVGRVAGLSEWEIKHQAAAVKPAPVVPKALVRGVTERVDYAGRVIAPLQEAEVRAAVQYLVEQGQVEAIAVCLLWSFMNPAHERRVREIVQELYGPSRVYLALSCELSPVIREYARSNTVILDSFLGPKVRGYVRRLAGKLEQNGYRQPLFIMHANGGLTQSGEIVPVGTLGSGPAGGMIAAKYFADLYGHTEVITTDMGGTSFDVGVLAEGFWRYEPEPVVARFHIAWPMIDIKSIGAGGGTIAWVDSVTRGLRLGPRSAGANPGPVAYGGGGNEPTVTDCNLVLGYLDPDCFLGGRIPLNRARAEAAIRSRLADPLGVSTTEAASAVYELVNGYMSDLIRKQVVATGHIPEEFRIYAFGGAGPVHAAMYGAGLGVGQVYVFPASPVFSSFGIAAADLVHTVTASHRLGMPADPAELNSLLSELQASLVQVAAREGVAPEQVRFRRTFLMRYRRQLNELDVEAPVKTYTVADVEAIMARFERRYEEVYGEGSSYREAGVELVSIRVDATAPMPKPRLRTFPLAGMQVAASARKGTRPVYWRSEGGFVDSPIYRYEGLQPGNVITGPAIVEAPINTVVIPPGCRGDVDRFLNICLMWEV